MALLRLGPVALVGQSTDVYSWSTRERETVVGAQRPVGLVRTHTWARRDV